MWFADKSSFDVVEPSKTELRWGKKEFSTLRRLTLSIFSVMVAAMSMLTKSYQYIKIKFFFSRKQARIFVRRSDKSKKDSKVSLTCKSGEFFVSGSEEKIAVEKATCNQKQEPRLDRKQEQCAPVGDDGRTDKLESLQRVSIGWQIEGTFIEQIGICIDESNFGTIWTNHTVRGASIALRDIDPKRPSFRADTGAYTRKNQRYSVISQ